MNILITGYGRGGKDTACEYLLRTYGMTFASSSWTMANEFIFDELKEDRGYGSVQECFDDRHSEGTRELWYNLITKYNSPDKTRLARLILSDNDIYCGLRSVDEFNACKEQGIFDLTIWIDAVARIGLTEDESSITIKPEDCDLIIKNESTEQNFYRSLDIVYNGVIKKI